MKTNLLKLMGAVLVASVACGAAAGPEVGAAAPDFTLKDTAGKEHSLADFKGKYVVLEWTNYLCPFVKKHYGSGNMQKLQETYTGKGAVWLSICSSAPGKQGYYEPEAWAGQIEKRGGKATAVLLDPTGETGRAYGAKTTPHMYVIGPDGVMRYKGAIDDDASWNPKGVKGAHNYVAAALDALMADEEVAEPETKPYGCSVKY